MNILIPHSWLLDHLETDADPTTIQKLVSLSGPSIERIYDREGESVYDIEVTTNRVDSMSVRGIARETAVILQQAGEKAKLKPLSLPEKPHSTDEALPLPTISNNDQYCKRIMCVILSDVAHTPTPDWMAQRLTQIEQNVHDSVIDITNYVTHELGHPCHAFDYDKIMALGGEIIVKEAQPGKKFTTLDGEAYETKGGEIVFENSEGVIIDLPAIKGTANTAVDDNTSRVLLWIESLDAKKVRTASMSHAIRTVAAQLNEKNVDPFLAEPTLLRAVQLYQELCSAKVASEMYDYFPNPPTPQTITVPFETITSYMGLSLPVEKMRDILTALECTVEVADESIKVTPPTFRSDLLISVDVIEEIARIYGYHNLPSTLMNSAIPTNRQLDTDFIIEERVKRFLAASGAQELYTYSMVSEPLALQDGTTLEEHLKLANPLTDDRIYLRRSLIPSLKEALDQMRTPNLTVFELANVYLPQTNQLPKEELHLTIVSNGAYRALHSHVEDLLHAIHIASLQIVTHSTADTSSPLLVTNFAGEQTAVGTVSIVHDKTVAFDFRWQKLLTVAASHPQYHPLPVAAPLVEDLTLTIGGDVPIGAVIAAMSGVSPLIDAVILTSQYQSNFTFQITYLDRQQPISTQAVAPIRSQLVELVTSQFQAALVGSLPVA
jgi:phenylalanyl-tRNA synthetase beta chain